MLKKMLTLFIGNFFSKGLGFIREVVIAYFFGTSSFADALRLAQTLIGVPTQLMMGSAFESAFVPTYKNSLKEKKDKELLTVLVIFFLVLSLICVLIFNLWGKDIINLISPGINPETSNSTLIILRMMSFGIPLYIITFIIIYCFNATDKYGLTSYTSISQNIIFILALFIGYYFYSPETIGLSFPLTFLVILLFIFLFRKTEVTIFIVNNYKFNKDSKKVSLRFVRSFYPLSIYAVVYQLNISIERFVSSQLQEGTISAVAYAKNLFETPVFLIAAPIATISLTYFSGLDWNESKSKIEKSIIWLLMIFSPITFYVFVNSKELIQLFYNYGNFNNESLQLTSQAMSGFSVSMLALAISLFLQRVFNANYRNFEFLIISVISIIINIILNFLLLDIYGVFGVSLSYSIGILTQALLLYLRLNLKSKSVLKVFVQVILTSLFFLYLSSFLSVIENHLIKLTLSGILMLIVWLVSYFIFSNTRNELSTVKTIFNSIRKRSESSTLGS